MTATDAPYKLAQRESERKCAPRPIATSVELRAYQEEHGLSALSMAKMVKRKMDEDPPT